RPLSDGVLYHAVTRPDNVEGSWIVTSTNKDCATKPCSCRSVRSHVGRSAAVLYRQPESCNQGVCRCSWFHDSENLRRHREEWSCGKAPYSVAGVAKRCLKRQG